MEYRLVEIGGMNSECVLGVKEFDNIDEEIDYCNENEICDINGVRFRNSYVDENWERDDFMCDSYSDVIDNKIVGVYGIDEGLELLEVESKA